MAAEAGDHARDVRRAGQHVGRQLFGVAAAVSLAEIQNLAVQAADVLAPQNHVARALIASLVGAVAPCAAMRCVAGGAAASIVEVGAEDVSRRFGTDLSRGETSHSQYYQQYYEHLFHGRFLQFDRVSKKTWYQ